MQLVARAKKKKPEKVMSDKSIVFAIDRTKPVSQSNVQVSDVASECVWAVGEAALDRFPSEL